MRFAVAQARHEESALVFLHVVEDHGADVNDDTRVERLA